MSVYNLVTHVADQTFLITITNINMSSLARCISSFRLSAFSLSFIGPLITSDTCPSSCVICISLICRDLRVESCLLSVRGHFLFFFLLLIFRLHHPTITQTHTLVGIFWKWDVETFVAMKHFPFARMSWGYQKIINGFSVHDNIDFSLPPTFWWICCWNFFCHLFFSFLDDPNWWYDDTMHTTCAPGNTK